MARCREAAQKVYNPAVHPREPYATGRNVRRSPFYEREKALGGYFMELGGWERAHGYAEAAHLLAFADRRPAIGGDLKQAVERTFFIVAEFAENRRQRDRPFERRDDLFHVEVALRGEQLRLVLLEKVARVAEAGLLSS